MSRLDPFFTWRKERWEFRWQKTHWVELYRDPANREKVREYWVRYRHLEEILELAPLGDDSAILDVGCGVSTVLHYLPGRRHGIDPNAERYRRAYDFPPEIRIRKGYAEEIPFPDGSFDAVFCSNCIDHTDDPVRAVSEIERVMRPGGHFVLTCEVFREDLGVRNVGHPHSMTAEHLESLVERFERFARWFSPWIGLRNYVLGERGTDQQEEILLLRKSTQAVRA